MKKLLVCSAVLLLLLGVGTAHASLILNFDPANTFSGTAPAGSLTATFSDVSGGVQLVITSSLANGENLQAGKALYFNINPSLDSGLSSLSFSLTANTGFSQAATVKTGADSYKADGVGGYYDILFTYAPSTKAFTSGESQTYLITDSGGSSISASDFNYLSTPSGGNVPWLAAVHVQNTPSGGCGSAWVGGSLGTSTSPVPIPPAVWLLASGLVGLAGIRRRFRK